MILGKLNFTHRNQRGFTMIEMLVSLAITGFISLGATIASAQVLNETARNNDATAASRQSMNAIFWISRDAQMALTTAGAANFPNTGNLTFTWKEWDNSVHQASYSLVNGELRRAYSVDGGTENFTLVAEYINPDAALTNSVSDNGVLTVKITSSVGEGDRIVNITKSRQVASRPNL